MNKVDPCVASVACFVGDAKLVFPTFYSNINHKILINVHSSKVNFKYGGN